MIFLSAHFSDEEPFGIGETIMIRSASEIEKHMADDDVCLLLWGGEDIGTQMYGERPNMYGSNYRPSQRDMSEMAMIREAERLNVPIIGICRGAQIICVAAGGKLAQHIEGHGCNHHVTLHDEGGTLAYCNSSHHQMMLPPQSAKILATSESTTGLDQFDCHVAHDRVNEVVYFPNVNGLGIQPHPEWANCPQEFINYCRRAIKKYLFF